MAVCSGGTEVAIRRAPRAPQFKAPARERDPRAWKLCGTCGIEHKGGEPGTYVVSSLLDPTIYFCGPTCYDRWVEARKPKSDPPPPSAAPGDPGEPLPFVV